MEKPNSVLLIGNFLSHHVGTHGASEELQMELEEKDWKVYHSSSQLKKILRLLDMLVTIYRFRNEYRVANVELYSGHAFIWAEICAFTLKILKKPYILSLHGGGLPDYFKQWHKRIIHLLNSADAVVTPSHFLASEFCLIRPDIKIIPNGIHLHNYLFRMRIKVLPKIIWLRAIHQIYNPLMAVEMMNLLVIHFPTAKLLIIGPNKSEETFQSIINLIDKYKLQDNITVFGAIRKDTVSEHLNHGDIFINTTNFESFGVSVMEAAACGLPIVTTNVGELGYLWQDNVDALLVPPDDPQAMAAAVRRILTEPGLAEKLSTNARKKAEGYDWSVVLPQWEALFESLIQQ